MNGRTKAAPAGDAHEMFRRRVADHDATCPGYKAAWDEWAGRLTGFAGHTAVPPLTADLMLDVLLAAAAPVAAEEVILTGGERSRCHQNAARLWFHSDGTVRSIATGYALSGDGMWRQHTWAVGHDGTLYETTTARTWYAGVELYGREALGFAFAAAPELTGMMDAIGREAARQVLSDD